MQPTWGGSVATFQGKVSLESSSCRARIDNFAMIRTEA